MPDDQRVRLAIQSPHRLDREVLAAYLGGQEAFLVLGKAPTLHHLHLLCQLSHPDAVVVELADATPEWLAELGALASAFPDVAVVLWYSELAQAQRETLAAAGFTELIAVAQELPALNAALMGLPRSPARRRVTPERGLKVLSLLASGRTVAEIADLLAISPHTVEHDKRRIYLRLGVGHQCQAVSVAVSLGLVDLGEDERGLVEDDRADAAPVRLSAREREILGSIADGHTVRETAQRLGIAVKTVENLQGRLFSKLGTHNRSQTLTKAYRMGLVNG
jgi:DNA-binding NarL/FixJ family response regulator